MNTQSSVKLIVLLALIILLSACGEPRQVDILDTGDIVVEQYNFSGFTEVEVDTFFEVAIIQGDEYQVELRAERALIPYVQIDQRGDRLSIDLRMGKNYRFENASHAVSVTLPKLTRSRANNHSTVILLGVEGSDDLYLEATDFSTISGDVTTERLEVAVDGHSSLVVRGSVAGVGGTISNFSSVDVQGLTAGHYNVSADETSSLNK